LPSEAEALQPTPIALKEMCDEPVPMLSAISDSDARLGAAWLGVPEEEFRFCTVQLKHCLRDTGTRSQCRARY